MSWVLDCPWQWRALISKSRRNVHVTQRSWLFSNYFPPAFLAGGSEWLGEWGSTLLVADEEDILHVRVTAPACLQLLLRGSVSLAIPASQRAGPAACLNHAGFCQLFKIFPLPHSCTKAGQMSAASSGSSNTSGAGSLHIFIFGPSDPSAMHSVDWVKERAKMVINCRTKSQSNNQSMALGSGCQVGEASERGFLFARPVHPTLLVMPSGKAVFYQTWKCRMSPTDIVGNEPPSLEFHG